MKANCAAHYLLFGVHWRKSLRSMEQVAATSCFLRRNNALDFGCKTAIPTFLLCQSFFCDLTMCHPYSTRFSLFVRYLVLSAVCVIYGVNLISADGPSDNFPDNVRLVPPKGIVVAEDVQTRWKAKSDAVVQELNAMKEIDPVDRWQIEGLLRAIRMTLEEEMFYNDSEIKFADSLLTLAEERLQALKEGKKGFELLRQHAILKPGAAVKPEVAGDNEASVKSGSYLIIGAFQSKIDQSLQPFGLVVPEAWRFDSNRPTRLDVWLHGRDEKSGEVGFLQRRLSQPGEFTPANTLVLHPYGRYSNAFKFAGEIDVLEGVEFISSLLPIDPNRISIRGFSMGGAGCWQMAVHYPGTWFAATPGAGFSETTEFLRIFQKEDFKPTSFQKSLLHWYDCPDWSSNLRYLPTIAYSGELDRQKQAADIMEASLRSKGIELPHLIGPQTDHKFHPDAKTEITQRLDQLAVNGRDEYPARIDFTTYTLRYSTHTWLTLERLETHWQEARIQASRTESELTVSTQNIERFSVQLPVSLFKLPSDQNLVVTIDDHRIEISPKQIMTDRSANPKWRLTFQKNKATWARAIASDEAGLAKKPYLQGPIDDAFMDGFVFVPSIQTAGAAATEATEHWTRVEYQHATSQWKRHFRGDIVTQSAETIAKILQSSMEKEAIQTELRNQQLDRHWILFGTPESNPVIGQLAAQLPIQWSKEKIQVGARVYDSANHALLMIYPNPFLPNRYIVLNSGFTFREYAYLNNARQIPMLPDWAIVDTASQPNSQWPGKIIAADFFDEHWQLKTP